MKFLPSPLNVVAVFAILFGGYSLATNPGGGDGLQNIFVLPMIGVGVVMLVVDFLLQKSIRQYKKVLLIEVVLLILFYGSISFLLRPQVNPTFVLPQHFDKDYVSVIYDVTNASDALKNPESIVVPTDGIIITNEKTDGTRSSMYFEGTLANGQEVNGFSSFSGTLDCKGKKHDYHIWYIKEGDEVITKHDSIKSQIQKEMIAYCKKNLQ